MIRKIIQIDQEKCNGCGLCATACHEGAIGIVNNKAVLLRDDYCDGLGDCLPACPTQAITFVEREAAAYDEAAVLARKQETGAAASKTAPSAHTPAAHTPSMLTHWPVQIKLAPVTAPYFSGAHLLIAADCTAYAYGSFHADFMQGRLTLIGCPKLDFIDYSEKLTEIIRQNDIQSILVTRMEVPCCGGMEHAVLTALKNSQKSIPFRVITLSLNGEILSDVTK